MKWLPQSRKAYRFNQNETFQAWPSVAAELYVSSGLPGRSGRDKKVSFTRELCDM